MKLDDALARLEALGTEKMRAQNIRHGVTGAQFGVKMGDIRAREGGRVRSRARAGTVGYRQPRRPAARRPADEAEGPVGEELDRLVRSNETSKVSDWLDSNVVKAHADKERLRQRWMASSEPIAARSGWSLTAERVAKSPEGLDLPALLDRIERELAGEDPLPQWTMNAALANIGIHHPEHRSRALTIGEALGVYRDYPTPPGCTSPFAPIWSNEMVRRQGSVA